MKVLAESLRHLGKREPTMQLALSRLHPGASIVETGCARRDGNWDGDGMSTVVFGEWVDRHDGHLWTVDIDARNLATARGLTSAYHGISYHLGDSIEFLSALDERVDLLYLDSLDYPYGELLDEYGGKDDIHQAIDTLAALAEAEIVERHGDLVTPSQRHCADELRVALPSLSEDALVLIDDAALPGGGKARLARLVLEEFGFECLLDAYQTLWAR